MATDEAPADVRWAPDGVEAAAQWFAPGAVGYEEDDATSRSRRRRRWAVLWTFGVFLALIGGYVGAAAIWPLTNVPPVIELEAPPAREFPDFDIDWPSEGGAAIGVSGAPSLLSHNDAAIPMASITKVVTALVMIDKARLRSGDPGPSYGFTAGDQQQYVEYLIDDQSAADVPVGGTLTLRQMLEVIMLESANNYVDRVVDEMWGSRDAFLADADAWLTEHELSDIRIVNPSGNDVRNVATPSSLVKLAEIALEDDVLAEIVAEPSVALPGLGTIENSNPLIGDRGIVGVKTGGIWDDSGDWRSLLSAKKITTDGSERTEVVAVMGMTTWSGRENASRSLYEDLEREMGPVEIAPEGTVVGTVRTPWGAQSEVTTAHTVSLMPWPATTPEFSVETLVAPFDTIDAEEGLIVGEVSATGPFDRSTSTASLTRAIPEPTLWWRVTHPLELAGIAT